MAEQTNIFATCPLCHGVPRHFNFNCAGEIRESRPRCFLCDDLGFILPYNDEDSITPGRTSDG